MQEQNNGVFDTKFKDTSNDCFRESQLEVSQEDRKLQDYRKIDSCSILTLDDKRVPPRRKRFSEVNYQNSWNFLLTFFATDNSAFELVFQQPRRQWRSVRKCQNRWRSQTGISKRESFEKAFSFCPRNWTILSFHRHERSLYRYATITISVCKEIIFYLNLVFWKKNLIFFFFIRCNLILSLI